MIIVIGTSSPCRVQRTSPAPIHHSHHGDEKTVSYAASHQDCVGGVKVITLHSSLYALKVRSSKEKKDT